MVYTVPFEELEDWLSAQPDNTRDTPYELNILNLTEERLRGINLGYSTLAGILFGMYEKYVDLRSTKIPDTIKTLDHTFFEVSTIVYSFDIPEGVETLNGTYEMCGIKEIPKLPNSLINIYNAFAFSGINSVPDLPPNIKNITTAFSGSRVKICKWLPEGIEFLENAFRRCQQLEEAYVPKNVGSVYGMLEDCNNLTKITIKAKAEDVLTLCGNDAEATIPVEGRVIYVEDTQVSQYRKYYKYFGLTSPDNVLEIENKIASFVELIKDANFITAIPSDEKYTITINPKTGKKTVNFWHYDIEGHFSESYRFSESLVSADLSGINFELIDGYPSAFYLCSNLKYLKLPSIDFTGLDISRMFFGCTSLKVLDLFNCTFNDIENFTEIFGLDDLTVYHDPDKWHISTNHNLGNAHNIKFLPVTTVDNEMIIDGKPISTFYHDNTEYDKIAINKDIFLLDNYNCLFGYDEKGEVDSESAMGTIENGQFEAWIFPGWE